MISYLKGKIIKKGLKSLIIEVNGVGYKVFTTGEVLAHNKAEIELFTYLAVRENSLDLYGFLNEKDLLMFEMLITISGIGPRTAMGIMNVSSVRMLENAILTGDTSLLTKVSGIGKKNAEKIIIELKGKISEDEVSLSGKSEISHDGDVIEALKSLGYSPVDARNALKEIPKNISGTNARIKEALKIISK
jgi:holliday junction DNA helicase RuvA